VAFGTPSGKSRWRPPESGVTGTVSDLSPGALAPARTAKSEFLQAYAGLLGDQSHPAYCRFHGIRVWCRWQGGGRMFRTIPSAGMVPVSPQDGTHIAGSFALWASRWPWADAWRPASRPVPRGQTGQTAPPKMSMRGSHPLPGSGCPVATRSVPWSPRLSGSRGTRSRRQAKSHHDIRGSSPFSPQAQNALRTRRCGRAQHLPFFVYRPFRVQYIGPHHPNPRLCRSQTGCSRPSRPYGKSVEGRNEVRPHQPLELR
jgi:hypothetical protein